MIGAGTAAVLLTHSPVGMLAAPAAGLLGYRKQFWRTAFVRRKRLGAVPPPTWPRGTPLIGTAMPFQEVLAGGALAIATTIQSPDGVIVRAIEAVPFWLVLADRRVLVTGECWLEGTSEIAGRKEAVAALESMGAGSLPIDRKLKRRLGVARVRLIPGSRTTVNGRVRDEQLAGAGGYRDALVEVVRGEPGASNWIETTASDGVAPARREADDAGA